MTSKKKEVGSTTKQDDGLANILKVLDPVETLIEVQGDPFKIQQFKFRESLKVLDIIKRHPNAIPFDLIDGNVDDDQALSKILLSAFEAGDAISEIIQLHLKKDDQWMDNLSLDDALKIALAIFKVNLDFFYQKLLPMIPTTINGNSIEEKA